MLYTFILIFVLMVSQGFCETPRLLITLGEKCDFNYKAVRKQVGAKIVSGTQSEIKRKIRKIDHHHSKYLIVLSQPLSNMEAFTYSMGYVHLHLNETRKEAFKRLKNTISRIPITDAALSRTKPEQVGRFYQLMMEVDRILKVHAIPYWATCGTVLGVVRHKGMIPWDDDLDIAMHEKDVGRLLELEKVLNQAGLVLCYHPKFDFYKICFADGQPIFKENGEKYPWTYPFVDIFPLVEVEGKYTYRGGFWQGMFKNKDYYLPEDLQLPLDQLPFGPMMLSVAKNPRKYLRRMYGYDWNKVAYVTYDHRHEEFLDKIKVKLCDRSQPDYVLPLSR